MLFKNLRTGNIVAATDTTSVGLMARSAIYEVVETAPAADSASARPEGKPRKKAQKAESEVGTDAAEAKRDG